MGPVVQGAGAQVVLRDRRDRRALVVLPVLGCRTGAGGRGSGSVPAAPICGSVSAWEGWHPSL